MTQIKNKIGNRYGLLVVKEMLPNYKNGRTYCRCDCDCGNETIVCTSNLRENGSHTTSCGCQSSRNGTNQYDFLHQCRFDNDKRIYCIYKHIAPNGKLYIGMTKQGCERRWQNGRGYKTQRLFWRAIQKYGWDNFTHEILEEDLLHDEACEREKYYISIYRSNIPCYGYNTTSGGDGCSDRGKYIGQFLDENIVNVFISVPEAASKLDLSETSIYNYINNNKKPGGYVFKEITYDVYLQDIHNQEHIDICKKYLREHNKKHLINRNKFKQISICQYSLDGKFIQKFESINQAMHITGCKNISRALKKDSHKDGNYLWYYDDGNCLDVKPYTYVHNTQRKVAQIDIRTGTILRVFNSMSLASNEIGVNIRQIWRVCNGIYKTTAGYAWRYID